MTMRVTTLHHSLPLALKLCRRHVHGPYAPIRARNDRSTAEIWSENTCRGSLHNVSDRQETRYQDEMRLHSGCH